MLLKRCEYIYVYINKKLLTQWHLIVKMDNKNFLNIFYCFLLLLVLYELYSIKLYFILMYTFLFFFLLSHIYKFKNKLIYTKQV